MMANKKRLVDVDEFTKTLEMTDANVCADYGDGFCEFGYSSSVLRLLLSEMQTVDAVEVVRCKDCTHWGGVPFGNVCRRWSAPLAGIKNCTGPDDFCSCGERRTDG